MSTNRRASAAKRQREADERERVRQREQRRADRRAARDGRTDAPETAPVEEPVLGVDGPRSLAELRAAQLAATAGVADPPAAGDRDPDD
jgi:hypothetical protein